MKSYLAVSRVKLFWFELPVFSIYCGGVEETWKFVIIFHNIYQPISSIIQLSSTCLERYTFYSVCTRITYLRINLPNTIKIKEAAWCKMFKVALMPALVMVVYTRKSHPSTLYNRKFTERRDPERRQIL